MFFLTVIIICNYMFVSLQLREGPLEKLWGGEEGGRAKYKKIHATEN